MKFHCSGVAAFLNVPLCNAIFAIVFPPYAPPPLAAGIAQPSVGMKFWSFPPGIVV
jgi:hypothetical protein